MEKLRELGVNLYDTKKDLKNVNNKLDTVIKDRNVKPDEKRLVHKYILLVRKDDDDVFKFVRGQDHYVNTMASKYNMTYEIVVKSTEAANPIDFVNRLRSRVKEVNKCSYKEAWKDLRTTEEYNSLDQDERELMRHRTKKESKLVYMKGNDIELLKFTRNDIIKLIKSIDEEKYQFL